MSFLRWRIVFGAIILIVGVQAEDNTFGRGKLSFAQTKPKQTGKPDWKPKRIARFGSVRFRHPGSIYDVSWSPDGTWLATAGLGNSICLWDAKTGTLLWQNQHHETLDLQGMFHRVAFTPDGKRLLSIRKHVGKYVAQTWDLRTKKEVCRFTTDNVTSPRSLAFSRDGTRFALAEKVRFPGWGDVEKRVTIKDVHTGKTLHQWTVNVDINSILFSPNGKQLAILAGRRGPTRLFLHDTATGKQLHEMRGFNSSLVALAFSSDGKHLSGAEPDGKIQFWSVTTGNRYRQLQGPKVFGNTLIFTDRDRALLSGSSNGLVVWHLATGKYRVVSTKHLRSKWVTDFAYCAANKTVVSWNTHQATLRPWGITAGKTHIPFPFTGHRGPVYHVSISSDNKELVAFGSDRRVRLWSFPFGQQTRCLEGDIPSLELLSFSNNHPRKILGGLNDGTMVAWDTKTGDIIKQCGLGAPGGQWALSTDRKRIARVVWPNGISLWNVKTRKIIRQWQGSKKEYIHGLRFSPSGDILASAHTQPYDPIQSRHPCVIRFWRVADGKEIGNLKGYETGIYGLTFSPDGKTLATCGAHDRAIKLIEMATMQVRAILQPIQKFTHRHLFSPNGRYFVSGGSDMKVQLWDLAAQQVIWTSSATNGKVGAVLFSKDSQHLVIGWGSGLIEVWKLPPYRRVSQSVSHQNLKQWWDDLASADAERAYRAIWKLALAPKQSIPFFEKHLKPEIIPGTVRKNIAHWIQQLDAKRFAAREQATTELKKLGRLAQPQITEALAKTESEEVRQRLNDLLSQLKIAKESRKILQPIRAIEVLERIRTDRARVLLRRLSEGTSGWPVTEHAKAALIRIFQ